jgi:hypothetical protein
MNEVTILIIIYHMIVFPEFVDSRSTQYKAGYSVCIYTGWFKHLYQCDISLIKPCNNLLHEVQANYLSLLDVEENKIDSP